MAGKKQSLIPEEKLAQALVPQDQQPTSCRKGGCGRIYWMDLQNAVILVENQ